MTNHQVSFKCLLFVYLLISTTEIEGKGGGRGGGRGGGFGSIFGSSASSKGGYRSVSGSSRKSFAQKNWKKAVAFGAGAYIGYKVSSKIRSTYNPRVFYYNGHHYNFDSWDRFTKVDGWLCRSDEDCDWFDANLGCDDREFDNYYVHGEWPWKNELKGRCSCRNGYWFDKQNGVCNSDPIGFVVILSLIAIIIAIVFCCLGCCFCIYKIT